MNELAIQIHPMVPLAKASAVLKISRSELIHRLSTGELLGEKRRIGESKTDSWFIYADEFNRLLTQAVSKYEERVSTRGLEKLFSPEATSRPPEATPPPLAPRPPLLAPLPPPPVAKTLTKAEQEIAAETLTETVTIDPVAFDHHDNDMAEIVDALGTNYALGSDYDNYDFSPGTAESQASMQAINTAPDSGLQVGQAMMAQLMQHLQDERQNTEALKDRLILLEDEVEQLRRELLARPDTRSHSPFNRMANYFRFLLGKTLVSGEA
jgi:hypothetical protein